jgi:hypothetical protein
LRVGAATVQVTVPVTFLVPRVSRADAGVTATPAGSGVEQTPTTNLEDVMAVAMLAEIPGLTREQYETVVAKVNQTGSPKGAVFHAGGPIENGYRVIEVWESREAADAFYNSTHYQQSTAGLSTHPEIVMTWSVFGYDDGTGWRMTT